MITREAKQIATEWIKENVEQFPGLVGAFFGGSVNVTPEDLPWPESSDIDILLIADVPRGLSTVHHKDVLLEIGTFPAKDFDLSFESIVSDFRYAIHFSVPSIILDPTGKLKSLHEKVKDQYSRRKWVNKRCQGAEKRVLDVLGGMLESIGFGKDTKWGAVFTLYYATFAAAEMLALADLRNPTIRKAFAVSSQVLESCNHQDLQESLLEVLGARDLSEETIHSHFDQLRTTIVEASRVIKEPFFFSDRLRIELISHNLAGVEEILDMGLPRESVFWIHFLLAIAQRAVEADAPLDSKKAGQVQNFL